MNHCRLLIISAIISTAFSQNATLPGTIVVPYPTILNIGIEWPFQGDANGNGIVTVRFRRNGETQWKNGQPLMRVRADTTAEGFSWPSRHAGSLFDLTPNSAYEIELTLADPDGGSTVRTATASTRPVPKSESINVRNATPATFASIAVSAQPGDILSLADGNYGAFTASHDGNAANPIVFRAQNEGGAIFTKFDLQYRKYLFLEGLTVNGYDPYGSVRMRGTLGCVVRRCRITVPQLPGSAITAYGPSGAKQAYIADNVITRSMTFNDASVGANGDNEGEGIQLTGPGNVVCFNKVKGFRDCISFFEDQDADSQICIDVYNNDIELGADDGIEADFAMGNCRILRNRLTNCFVGVSSQPGLGGPAYFMRNVMYNVIYSPFKLHRGGAGDVALHNTAVKCGDAFAIYPGVVFSRALFYNNIFIGGSGGGTYGGYGNGSGRVLVQQYADADCVFDHDGYGSIGTGTFAGRFRTVVFNSLLEMKNLTTERNAVALDMNVFQSTVPFPVSGPYPEKTIPDLRIRSGSPAVDAGKVIVGINEGYLGNAPDLGAYEADDSLPLYGPRPPGVDEETSIETGTSPTMNDRPYALTLFPQPVRAWAVARFSDFERIVRADVYSISGKPVAALSLKEKGLRAEWRCNSLPAGLYLLKASGASGRKAGRLVIKI